MNQFISGMLCASILLAAGASAAAAPLAEAVRVEAAGTVAKPPAQVAAGLLTLDGAIERALRESPRLESFRFAQMASAGARLQAGALPNPELGVDTENFGGAGSYGGFEAAEVTIGVSQLVEIGGKRSARKEVARQSYEISNLDYEAARLDLIRDVTISFVEAVAAKEALGLAEKQKSVAREVLENVSERVNAAAEPLFQRSKSMVAFSTSEMALEKAKSDSEIALKQLAALWGSEEIEVSLDSSQFFEITPVDPQVNTNVPVSSPDLKRWDAEVARSRAYLDLERANAIPDPSLSFGMRDFRESGDRAFMAGISIPIPVFNLNAGNIERAARETNKAESDKRSAEIMLVETLARSQRELESAYRRAKNLKGIIIPAAEEAYSLTRYGYRAGKFPYLEVLDAQRTLVEVRVQYNESLKEYHAKRAEVERITAKRGLVTNKRDYTDE